jgi:hypothetical protein
LVCKFRFGPNIANHIKVEIDPLLTVYFSKADAYLITVASRQLFRRPWTFLGQRPSPTRGDSFITLAPQFLFLKT